MQTSLRGLISQVIVLGAVVGTVVLIGGALQAGAQDKAPPPTPAVEATPPPKAEKVGEVKPEAGPSKQIPEGMWGGKGVSFVVEGSSAKLEFDCAHATLEVPIKLDANGSFEFVAGLVREGGPVRPLEYQSFDGSSARFSGRLDGNSLTLKVLMLDRQKSTSSHVLTQGQPGVFRKCK